MTHRRLFILLLSVGLLFTSACKKKTDVDLLGTNWEVIGVYVSGAADFVEPEETHILQIKEDARFEINLEVNEANGTANFTWDGYVTFEFDLFTRLCCDGPFSDLLVGHLEDVNQYYVKGKRLFLHDEDQVYLKLKPVK